MYIRWYSTKPSHQSVQFNGITPNLPIVHRIDYVMLHIFYDIVHEIVMQGFLMVYHGISHSSLVFSLHTHEPLGECLYKENTNDSWDIPRYTTLKHCITSMFTPCFDFIHLLSETAHPLSNWFYLLNWCATK